MVLMKQNNTSANHSQSLTLLVWIFFFFASVSMPFATWGQSSLWVADTTYTFEEGAVDVYGAYGKMDFDAANFSTGTVLPIAFISSNSQVNGASIGTWQYCDAMNMAQLIDMLDSVGGFRFLPTSTDDHTAGGVVTLTFQITNGTDTEEVTINYIINNVNDPPTWRGLLDHTFSEHADSSDITPYGQLLLSANVSDIDDIIDEVHFVAKSVNASVAGTEVGTWVYLAGGASIPINAQYFVDAVGGSPLLSTSNGTIYFVPTNGDVFTAPDSVSLTFYLVDNVGQSADYTLRYTITPVNDRPTISGLSLVEVDEGFLSTTGDSTPSQRVGGMGDAADVETPMSANIGRVVTGLSNEIAAVSVGAWRYRTTSIDVGTDILDSTLLAADWEVFFVVSYANFEDVNTAGLSDSDVPFLDLKAWDGDTGTAGMQVSGTNSSAFSTNKVHCTLRITSVDDDPVWKDEATSSAIIQRTFSEGEMGTELMVLALDSTVFSDPDNTSPINPANKAMRVISLYPDGQRVSPSAGGKTLTVGAWQFFDGTNFINATHGNFYPMGTGNFLRFLLASEEANTLPTDIVQIQLRLQDFVGNTSNLITASYTIQPIDDPPDISTTPGAQRLSALTSEIRRPLTDFFVWCPGVCGDIFEEAQKYTVRLEMEAMTSLDTFLRRDSSDRHFYLDGDEFIVNLPIDGVDGVAVDVSFSLEAAQSPEFGNNIPTVETQSFQFVLDDRVSPRIINNSYTVGVLPLNQMNASFELREERVTVRGDITLIDTTGSRSFTIAASDISTVSDATTRTSTVSIPVNTYLVGGHDYAMLIPDAFLSDDDGNLFESTMPLSTTMVATTDTSTDQTFWTFSVADAGAGTPNYRYSSPLSGAENASNRLSFSLFFDRDLPNNFSVAISEISITSSMSVVTTETAMNPAIMSITRTDNETLMVMDVLTTSAGNTYRALPGSSLIEIDFTYGTTGSSSTSFTTGVPPIHTFTPPTQAGDTQLTFTTTYTPVGVVDNLVLDNSLAVTLSYHPTNDLTNIVSVQYGAEDISLTTSGGTTGFSLPSFYFSGGVTYRVVVPMGLLYGEQVGAGSVELTANFAMAASADDTAPVFVNSVPDFSVPLPLDIIQLALHFNEPLAIVPGSISVQRSYNSLTYTDIMATVSLKPNTANQVVLLDISEALQANLPHRISISSGAIADNGGNTLAAQHIGFTTERDNTNPEAVNQLNIAYAFGGTQLDPDTVLYHTGVPLDNFGEIGMRFNEIIRVPPDLTTDPDAPIFGIFLRGEVNAVACLDGTLVDEASKRSGLSFYRVYGIDGYELNVESSVSMKATLSLLNNGLITDGSVGDYAYNMEYAFCLNSVATDKALVKDYSGNSAVITDVGTFSFTTQRPPPVFASGEVVVALDQNPAPSDLFPEGSNYTDNIEWFVFSAAGDYLPNMERADYVLPSTPVPTDEYLVNELQPTYADLGLPFVNSYATTEDNVIANQNLMGIYTYYVRRANRSADIAVRKRSAFARVQVTVIGTNEIQLTTDGDGSNVLLPATYYVPVDVAHIVRVNMITAPSHTSYPISTEPTAMQTNLMAVGGNSDYNAYSVSWTADYGIGSRTLVSHNITESTLYVGNASPTFFDRVTTLPIQVTFTNTYTGGTYTLTRDINISDASDFALWFAQRTMRVDQQHAVCQNSGLQDFVRSPNSSDPGNFYVQNFLNLAFVGSVPTSGTSTACQDAFGSPVGTVLCGYEGPHTNTTISSMPYRWSFDTTSVPPDDYTIQRNNRLIRDLDGDLTTTGDQVISNYSSGQAGIMVLASHVLEFTQFSENYCSQDSTQHTLLVFNHSTNNTFATGGTTYPLLTGEITITRKDNGMEVASGTPSALGAVLFTPSTLRQMAVGVGPDDEVITFTIVYTSDVAEDTENACVARATKDFTIHKTPTPPSLDLSHSPNYLQTSTDVYTGFFCADGAFESVVIDEAMGISFVYKWYRDDGHVLDVTSVNATNNGKQFTADKGRTDGIVAVSITAFNNYFTRTQYAVPDGFAGCESSHAQLITQSLALPDLNDSQFAVQPAAGVCVDAGAPIEISTTHISDEIPGRYATGDYEVTYTLFNAGGDLLEKSFTSANGANTVVYMPIFNSTGVGDEGLMNLALGVDSTYDFNDVDRDYLFGLRVGVTDGITGAHAGQCTGTITIEDAVRVNPLPVVDILDFANKQCEEGVPIDLRVNINDRLLSTIVDEQVDWSPGSSLGTFTLQYRDNLNMLATVPSGSFYTATGAFNLQAAVVALQDALIIDNSYVSQDFRLLYQNNPGQVQVQQTGCVGADYVDFTSYQKPISPVLSDTNDLLYCEGGDQDVRPIDLGISLAPGAHHSWYRGTVDAANRLDQYNSTGKYTPSNLVLDRDLPGNVLDNYKYMITYTQHDETGMGGVFAGCTSDPTEVEIHVIARPDILLTIPEGICVGRIVGEGNSLSHEENLSEDFVRITRQRVWTNSNYTLSSVGLVGDDPDPNTLYRAVSLDAAEVEESITQYGSRSSSTPGAMDASTSYDYSPLQAVRAADAAITHPADFFDDTDQKYTFELLYEHVNVYEGKSCSATTDAQIRVHPLPEVGVGVLGDADFGVNTYQLEKQVCVSSEPFTLTGSPSGMTESFTVNQVQRGSESFFFFDPDAERRRTTEAFFTALSIEKKDFQDLVADFEEDGEQYYHFHDNTEHVITYRHADANACENFFTKKIVINSLPLLSFSPSFGCAELDIPFSVIVVNEGSLRSVHSFSDQVISDFSWDFGDLSAIADLTNPNLVNGPENVVSHYYSGTAGDYTVALNATTFSGCQNLVQLVVTLGKTPKPVFYWDGVTQGGTTTFYFGDEAHQVYHGNAATHETIADVTFALAAGDRLIDQISRTRQDTNRDGVVSSQDEIPANMFDNFEFSFQESGTYTATLTMSTVYGCLREFVREVKILPHIQVTLSYATSFEDDTHEWFAEYTRVHEEGLARFNDAPLSSSWEVSAPRGTIINSSAGEQLAWITNAAGDYFENESSWVYSPEFDISAVERPMVEFDIAWNFDTRRDGAVLQYSIDDGEIWYTVGDYHEESTGIGWYNYSGISSDPGNQFSVDDSALRTVEVGWGAAAPGDVLWHNARHKLDFLSEDSRHKVRFRFAMSSDSSGTAEGVAIDNFKIRSRTRGVLLEEFASELSLLSKIAHEEIQALLGGLDAGVRNSLIGVEGEDLLHAAYYIYSEEIEGNDRLYAVSPAEFSARSLYYGVGTIPSSILAGDLKYGERDVTLSSTWSVNDLNIQSLQDPAVDIHLEPLTSNVLGEISFSARISFFDEFPLKGAHHLYVLLVEREVTLDNAPNGQRTFHNVVRRIIPNGAGIIYHLPLEEDIQHEMRFTMSPHVVTDVHNTFLIACFQNDSTREVYQATKLDISLLDGIGALGVEPLSSVLTISVYPNPVDEMLTIHFLSAVRGVTVRLFDVLGRLILQEKVPDMQAGTHTLGLLTVPNGVYFLWIQGAQENEKRHVIIQHAN